MDFGTVAILVVIVFLALVVAISSIRIINEYERGVVFRLGKLLPLQRADFEGIFEAMAGLPVTIRLLDPPLHEFLPPLEEATDERMRGRIKTLHEANPMLGTRGCRLGIQWPEIYEMQVRAIARAAADTSGPITVPVGESLSTVYLPSGDVTIRSLPLSGFGRDAMLWIGTILVHESSPTLSGVFTNLPSIVAPSGRPLNVPVTGSLPVPRSNASCCSPTTSPRRISPLPSA